MTMKSAVSTGCSMPYRRYLRLCTQFSHAATWLGARSCHPRPMAELIAVLDVGRAHAKLSLIDVESGESTWHLQRRCATIPGSPSRSLGVVTVGSLVLAALAGAPNKDRIR